MLALAFGTSLDSLYLWDDFPLLLSFQKYYWTQQCPCFTGVILIVFGQCLNTQKVKVVILQWILFLWYSLFIHSIRFCNIELRRIAFMPYITFHILYLKFQSTWNWIWPKANFSRSTFVLWLSCLLHPSTLGIPVVVALLSTVLMCFLSLIKY